MNPMDDAKPRPPLPRRIWNLATAVLHKLRWSPRFSAFGFRSRIVAPDMLTNGRCIRIGKRVSILKGARMEAVGTPGDSRPKIVIGDNTSIQMYFHVGAAESVTIGRDVLIAGRVYVTDHDHEFEHPTLPPRSCEGLRAKPVVIEDGAWLGEGCVILKGVTVGRRAVVGANAVVTKDVPPGAIVGGIPARVIRMIDLP